MTDAVIDDKKTQKLGIEVAKFKSIETIQSCRPIQRFS